MKYRAVNNHMLALDWFITIPCMAEGSITPTRHTSLSLDGGPVHRSLVCGMCTLGQAILLLSHPGVMSRLGLEPQVMLQPCRARNISCFQISHISPPWVWLSPRPGAPRVIGIWMANSGKNLKYCQWAVLLKEEITFQILQELWLFINFLTILNFSNKKFIPFSCRMKHFLVFWDRSHFSLV